jgi:hypothetical protein
MIHFTQMNKIVEFSMELRILDKPNELIACGSKPTVRCKPHLSAGNAGTTLRKVS